MASSNSRVNVPEARAALDAMKYEVARELNINLKQGYNGDLTSRDNGYVGGYMVKKMIEDYERQSSGSTSGKSW
ncbi:MAG: alpha/beta-type small acid-soluble spore protein [Clostridiales bacterium]|nr:alpha/beta-type small acid-soluble spore protein [Clostridiales bacterium]